MRLALTLPHGAIGIAFCEYKGGEVTPTAEFAISLSSLAHDPNDGHLTDHGEFQALIGPNVPGGSAEQHNVILRSYTSSPGCGILFRSGRIAYTEPGLDGFVGKAASLIQVGPATDDAIIVVWADSAGELSNQTQRRLAALFHGLRNVFRYTDTWR